MVQERAKHKIPPLIHDNNVVLWTDNQLVDLFLYHFIRSKVVCKTARQQTDECI